MTEHTNQTPRHLRGSSLLTGAVPVAWAERIESAEGIDRYMRLPHAIAEALMSNPTGRDLLTGRWLGHAVHPLLTDLPVGFWTSATVLDLAGGRESRNAATKLVGLGLLTAVPTIATGWAEWSRTGVREQRVGLLHAALNASAVFLYAGSLAARARRHHGAGVSLGFAGATAASAAGFLGGHLAAARKVSSRNTAFES